MASQILDFPIIFKKFNLKKNRGNFNGFLLVTNILKRAMQQLAYGQ
jgi:hypothetical protein